VMYEAEKRGNTRADMRRNRTDLNTTSLNNCTSHIRCGTAQLTSASVTVAA